MNEPKRKLRLVFAHNGVDAYDRLFVNRLALDFETYFLTFLKPTQAFEEASIVKLPDFGKPLRTKKLNNIRIAAGTPWRIFQMKRHLSLIRPDVVIGNWVTTYGLYVWLSGWRPFVLFAYGSDIVVDPKRSLFHWIITRKVVQSADLVLIDSEVQRRALLALGCSPNRIVSFPWFDLTDLRLVSRDSTFRRKRNWEGKSIVVSVRKHEPIYAVDTLIRAIPTVIARSPNVRFLIFGSGTQTPALMKLASELNVNHFLHFAGNVSRKELLGYMKDCDVYVSTSLSDGSSSSLLEAMSFGIPVVVTAIPGNAEWILGHVNGLMFAKGDSEGLAGSIISLSSNPKEAHALAQRAKSELQARVRWEPAMRMLIKGIYDAWSRLVGN